ncbi:hypothetical protein J3E69DRAFT_335140 [Trichoderma sp. SZMC 28015]
MDENSQNHQPDGQLLIETAERVGQNPRVGPPGTGIATSKFTGQGIQHTGHGDFHVSGNVNITTNNAAPTTAVEEDCLRSLFITDPSEDRTALKRKKGNRAAGTCEWILETEELAAWLDQQQTSNILWLYGNPGTGKSTMAIFLTEKLSTLFSVPEGKTLAYFFCDSSFEKRKTATSIIRGLLYQLVKQNPKLLEYISPKYIERGPDLFKSFDALWTIFIAAAADQKTGRKYCVIDALDECDRESQKILLQQFQETFQNQDAPSNIRILVTSRPYPEIREYLDQFANKNLASFHQTKEDIDRCIEEKVADLVKKKRYTDKVKHQVSNILRDKAEGTFLWVGLACEELKEIPSKDAVKVLQNMPKGLHSLYKALLEAAQEESEADIIRSILSLVAVCMRPLNVLELSEACQLFEEEEDIETRVQYTRDQIASCRLMIIIQDEKVLLLHQSVKDFLVGTSPDYFINELEVHANIVYRCVHLLMEEFHGREQSSIHFFPYAIRRWPDHARMAQSKFEIRDSEAQFFQPNSRSREHWLRTLHDHMDFNRKYGYLEYDYYDIPPQMSILHIAARWGIASLVDYSIYKYCNESSTKTNISFVDLDCVDSENRTPIELAVKWGFITVISKFLDLGAVVNEAVVIASAENQRNGEEVMTLLLGQRGDQITITEDIVKAAAGNENKEVMALLFDRRGNQITVTEDIVKAAAGNYQDDVMKLLFDRRGHEITITEEVIKAAASNLFGKKVLALLLDRRGSQIKITKDIFKAAVRHSRVETIALLLDCRDTEITITEEVVMAAAKNTHKGVMVFLLEYRGNNISVTEEMINVLWKNFSCGKEVMAFLLDQRKDIISFTEDIVSTIAEHFDEEILALLFEKCGDQVVITEKVVKAVVKNYQAGEDIMALLLDQWGNEITVTEEILKAAASNLGNGKEIMTFLFNRRGYEIVITKEVLKASAKNPMDSKVMMFLLSQQAHKVTITEEVVEAAAQNPDIGAEVMALLLDWQGDPITITEDIIVAATRNQRKGKEIMTLLLDRRGNEITITKKVISATAAVSDKKMMELLLHQRGHEITITETALIAAAGNWYHGKEVISLLLSQRGAKITITEDILRAAARNIKSGKEVMLLLLSQRDYPITITEEVVELAARNSMEVMEFLLNHRGNEIAITEDVLKAAISRHKDTKVITLLLNQQEHKISITEEVIETAAKTADCANEMIALFLNQQGHHIAITEQVVKAAAGNEFCGKELMKLLLDQRGHQVTITEEVVKAAAGNEYNGKKIMKLLLDQRGHQVTITEDVVKAAAGNEYSGRKMMKLLLDRRGHQFSITEEVIKAAAGNPSNGKEVILLLLQERGHQVIITEEVVKAAAGNYLSGKKVMELLLNQRGHQVTITEGVIRSAAACGQDDVLDLLSKDKSIVTDWDKWRCISKFYNAAKTGNVSCIKQLLNQGVEPDTKNFWGETPLWIAAKYCQTSVLQLLAQEKGVDVNSLSNSSASLLFWVCQQGYENYAAILMKAGADPCLVNKDGHTAITIAKKHGYSRIVKMLERLG